VPGAAAGELGRLRARERQLQAVAELGLEALGSPTSAALLDQAVRSVAGALAVEIVAIEELQAGGDLLVHASVGVVPGALGRQQAGAGDGSQAGYTLQAGAPVITEELASETRFRPAAVLTRSQARSSLSVAIGPRERPWGVLLAASTSERRFSEDDAGFLQGVANVLAMARERGESERAVRASEELLSGGFERSPIGMTLANVDGTFNRVNVAFAQMLGYEHPDLLVGVSMASVTHPEDRAKDRLAMQMMLEQGVPFSGEKRYVRADGEVVDAQLGSTVVRDQRGQPLMFFGQVRDVTESRRAEALLYESRSRLQSILDHAPAAIYLMDLDGRFVVINDELERVLGAPRDQALGELREHVLPARAAAQHRANDLEVVRRGAAIMFEETAPGPDGEHIYQSVKFPLRDQTGAVYGVGGISTDVTDQRTAERERERALADLEEAQQLARVGSWSWNPQTEQVSWSAQMYAIFDRDPAAGPPSIGEFLTYAHPEDRERVADAYAQALGGQAALELECRIVTGADVQRTVHLLAHKEPDRPGSYLGTVQDVTRQRRGERERFELLEASARAESANRAKSEFLARMSHELRTPLNSIIGFSQVLQLEQLAPRHHKDIDHILKAGNFLLALVNEVLDLARIESGQMTISLEPVALADTIHDALTLVAPLARDRDVSLNLDTDGLAHDGHVHADRNRLKQVLLNVLSNAIKYNRPGGQVDISFQITDNGRVRTMVADTGTGIAPEHLAKLFEPFERLGAERTDVEGTGLGLALSKALIEAMGGTIEVESKLGSGTTFGVELAAAQRPRAERQPSPGERQLPERDADAKRKLILYIEDNLSNLTLVERILERQPSVELISALQGTLGLELARQHRPDLVILDLHLPDIPGTDVLTRLKAEPATRETPVIVITADASARHADRVRTLGATDYMTKPIDVPKFIAIIANNLADQPPGED